MMKMIRLLAAVPVLLVPIASGHSQDTKAKEAQFQAMIKQVRDSDPSVDFGLLRKLSTELPSYAPIGGGKHRKEMNAGLTSRSFKQALEAAREDLKDNYLDVDAHIGALIASGELGDTQTSAHHKYVVKGIIDSILASGDGKTAATALHVIAVSEEYALLRVMGLRMKAQGINHIDGHAYDVLTVVDPTTNEEYRIFFNIDPVWTYETKLFSK
jgi:hypothetical protein